MTPEKTMKTEAEVFDKIVNERRSVRIYDQEAPFDSEAVTRSLKRAILSPNSSNMQLWEFYRIKSPEKRAEIAKYCMGQKAASTARELIVVVARPDLWKGRKEFNRENIARLNEGKDDATAKRALSYYDKLIPMLYRNDSLGISTFVKRIFSWFIGFKRPMVREVGKTDVRVVVNKSAALAAMTFMYSMKAEGYDTCPMEGMDSKRVKKLLGLPHASEINMIIGVGPIGEGGVYSERFRLPYEEVVFEI